LGTYGVVVQQTGRFGGHDFRCRILLREIGLTSMLLIFLTAKRQAARSHLNHFIKIHLSTASKNQFIHVQ